MQSDIDFGKTHISPLFSNTLNLSFSLLRVKITADKKLRMAESVFVKNRPTSSRVFHENLAQNSIFMYLQCRHVATAHNLKKKITNSLGYLCFKVPFVVSVSKLT